MRDCREIFRQEGCLTLKEILVRQRSEDEVVNKGSRDNLFLLHSRLLFTTSGSTSSQQGHCLAPLPLTATFLASSRDCPASCGCGGCVTSHFHFHFPALTHLISPEGCMFRLLHSQSTIDEPEASTYSRPESFKLNDALCYDTRLLARECGGFGLVMQIPVRWK